jgi:hypothetical protein
MRTVGAVSGALGGLAIAMMVVGMLKKTGGDLEA